MRQPPAAMRRLLWILGVLWVVYLVIGNVFLNTAANAIVNRKPATFQAQWAWAWTAWPGQLHVHDLNLNGHAHRLLWHAHGASAGGRIAILPLFTRELRFVSVRAVEVTVNLQRSPVDHQPPPFRSDAWHLAVDGVQTSSLRQVRWGELLVEGDGAGKLVFTHQLRGGATRIFPSHVAMSGAKVSYGRWALLHDGKLSASFAFDAFTHDNPRGWRKAERAHGQLKIEAATRALALGANSQGSQAVAVSALPGHLSAELGFDRGSLLPGGQLQWNAPVAITEADGTQQRRRGQFDLNVEPKVVNVHVRVPPPSGAANAKTMNQLQADLQWAGRDLLPARPMAEELGRISGAVDARWHFASLTWLEPLLASKPWLHLDGEGDIDVALKLDAGHIASGSTLDVPRVALRAEVLGNVFAGEAQAHAEASGTGKSAHIDTTLDVDRFMVTRANSSATAFLRGRNLKVTTQSAADLARQSDTLDARMRFSQAEIPDLRAYNRYLPGKSLEFLAGSGTLDSDLHVNGHGDISNGKLRMRSKDARLALGVSRLTGQLDLQTQLALAQRGDGHTFDLDEFTLGLDGVHVEGTNDPPWWTRVTLKQGQLDWNRPMRLRGSASMTMKDVSLLLSLFADRSAFPKWIASVINAGQATAKANVQVQKGDFVIDHLVASNQRVDLYAHLRIRDGQPAGDLYARWGILGLGVALADGKRQFHLLHAREWYESQPDLIPAEATKP